MSDEQSHRCPICDRENGRGDGDWCSHYLAFVYDHEYVDGPEAEEYEELWQALEEVANDLEAPGHAQLLPALRRAKLADVAKALDNDDKFWWIPEKNSVFIDARTRLIRALAGLSMARIAASSRVCSRSSGVPPKSAAS